VLEIPVDNDNYIECAVFDALQHRPFGSHVLERPTNLTQFQSEFLVKQPIIIVHNFSRRRVQRLPSNSPFDRQGVNAPPLHSGKNSMRVDCVISQALRIFTKRSSKKVFANHQLPCNKVLENIIA
jgi:hypothetical protein